MPSETQLIQRAAWSTQPWKNGGGITHEIWRWQASDAASSGDPNAYDLRLSVAEIEGAQPFSVFPNFYRTLIPLEENALELVIDNLAAPLTKHVPFHFPGDVPPHTKGVGRATDLNVISRRERKAQVEISKSESHRTSPPVWPVTRVRNLAVFALEATTLSNACGTTIALAPFDTWIEITHGNEAAFVASQPVVWIRFG